MYRTPSSCACRVQIYKPAVSRTSQLTVRIMILANKRPQRMRYVLPTLLYIPSSCAVTVHTSAPYVLHTARTTKRNPDDAPAPAQSPSRTDIGKSQLCPAAEKGDRLSTLYRPVSPLMAKLHSDTHAAFSSTQGLC